MGGPTQSQRIEALENDFATFRTSMEDSFQRLTNGFLKQQEEFGQLRAEMRTLIQNQAAAARDSQHEPANTGFSRPLEGGASGGAQGAWRFKKLDLPLFDGSNPDGWILRIERFFQFYRMNEEEKLEGAVVALEGRALSFFQFENNRRTVRTWEDLKKLILRRFRMAAAGATLHAQWLALRQTGTVEHYIDKYIELIAPLTNIAEEISTGQFLNGLKEDIRQEVVVLEPTSLDHAMELALKIEGKMNYGNTKKLGVNYTKPNSYTPYSSNFTQKNSNSPNPTYSNSVQRTGPITPFARPAQSTQSVTSPVTLNTQRTGGTRRLTDSEWQLRREKGQCFRCDEHWAPGHRCKRQELSVLLVNDEVEELNAIEEGPVGANGELGEEDQPTLSSISLNSIVGFSNPKTMKLIKKFGGAHAEV